MDVRIAVETKRTHQLEGISRPCRVTCPDGIGLRLEDGKRIVEQIQRVVHYDQVDEIIRESRVCPDCASVRAIHDYRTTARAISTRSLGGFGSKPRAPLPLFL